jgi:hypothetical protein
METRVGRYLIYGLIDPRDQCLRYVGKTHKRREWRLAEHIESAMKGSSAPVHQWIRVLQALGEEPEILVLTRISSRDNWQDAERAEIARWRAWPDSHLPYVHPPQTPKSQETLIASVSLLNVQDGG